MNGSHLLPRLPNSPNYRIINDVNVANKPTSTALHNYARCQWSPHKDGASTGGVPTAGSSDYASAGVDNVEYAANVRPELKTATTDDHTDDIAQLSRADREAIYLLPDQSNLAQDTSIPFATTLASRGAVRVNDGLSPDIACRLRQFIDDTLESSLEEVDSFKVPRAFGFANVLEKGNRWDLLLPLFEEEASSPSSSSGVMLEAMNELLGENGKIAPILQELLGDNAILYELACLISDPGSNRQEIHPDILFDSNTETTVPLIACFVSLQDIDASMGPTVFIPGTVTEDHHRRINDEKLANEMLKHIPSNISTLGVGDCALYNPMVLHAGGGNVSNRRRRLFYFTFMNLDFQDPSNDSNPGSINPILKQRNLTLREVRECLAGSLPG